MVRRSNRKILDEIQSDKIKGFQNSIKEGGNENRYLDGGNYPSLKRLAETIRDDYTGRFLIELIQNGYDAHESDSIESEIAIFC